MLGPVLDQVFPRRRIPWQDTSDGLRARIALLADNPHLERDVATVRRVLRIPKAQLRARPGGRLWNRLSHDWYVADRTTSELTREIVGQLVGQWLRIHIHTALGLPLEHTDGRDLLRAEFRSAQASALVDLGTASDAPTWLRRYPLVDEAPLLAASVPLDRAILRLLERHHLPYTSWGAAALHHYVLTRDRAWLAGGDFAQTLVALGDVAALSGPLPYDGLSVSAYIDEFVTADDWMRVWKSWVRPRVNLLLLRPRGAMPRGQFGKRVGPLVAVMPVYREMVLREVGIEDALSLMVARGEVMTKEPSLSELRRRIGSLTSLLVPSE